MGRDRFRSTRFSCILADLLITMPYGRNISGLAQVC